MKFVAAKKGIVPISQHFTISSLQTNYDHTEDNQLLKESYDYQTNNK